MSMRRYWGTVALLAVLAGAAVSVVAQSAPPPTTPSSNELLTEVRGLRADLQQAAKISLRAQLLVGRLQLQEQRINITAGRLAEIRRLIGVSQSGQIPLTEQLRQLDEARRNGNVSAEQLKDVENQIPMLKAQLTQIQRQEQQLHLQETEVAGELTTEQAAWTDFNARLDELERLLPIGQR